MVRLAAGLAWALAGVEAMSLTKQLSQRLSQSTNDPPHNFLVLRLAHSGSSWLTAMIGSQADTYITREAMWPFNPNKPEQLDYVESLGKQGVLDYLEHALTVPSGNILDRKQVQLFCDGSADTADEHANQAGSTLVSRAEVTMDSFMQPKTCDCLREHGSKCPLKFLGMTLDPTSQVLKDNLQEILTAIKKTHPDMPVLVLRRSNIVKHSLASGGITDVKDEGGYSVALHQNVNVTGFVSDVRDAFAADKMLRQAAEYFPHVKTVSYEDMYKDPKTVMEHVFKFLGMPEGFQDWMGEIGDKHTPDDLHLLIKNYGEVVHELEKLSPCLAKQFRATKNEKYPDACDDL